MMALGVGDQYRVDETTAAASGEVWADRQLLEYLQGGKKSEEWDALERDRVYRRGTKYRWLGTSLYKVGEKGRMLVIPRPPEREGLVKKVHEEMGHFGVMRVADQLEKTYWWRGMVEIVAKVVKEFMSCARGKAAFRESGKNLQPLPMKGPMYRWGVDFAGPMEETKRGNRYVLVCIKHFTSSLGRARALVEFRYCYIEC